VPLLCSRPVFDPPFEQLEFLMVMRSLRVLRPLRLLLRDAGMKVVIEALIASAPSVANILAIIVTLMAVFAIVGMRLFLGAFASCSDEAVSLKVDCVGELPSGLPREWRNPWVGNFDSFSSSMMTLFQAVTADTLPDLIFAGMDATGVDQPPVPTDWSWTALYFLLWLLVGNFMALNLFVGAIVDNFQTTRRETDDWALLTPEQQQWVRMVKSLPSTRPIRPPAPPTVLRWLRAPLYQLALSERWQVLSPTSPPSHLPSLPPM
jgi:hypothetical protein